ncbi:hypothetical protein NLJ89_g4773 [Agrocybe chaxingu]|uniref:Autophagy-related protein 3 n=1 Tax=Agrocybe chaxingu TaxID=84603 RepID=A0A9W8K1G2_9AGAR|nr:hypothetical protein NLJ89_g4773 [Agrocybe chaxingu]
MEEDDLEDGDEATAAPKPKAPASAAVTEPNPAEAAKGNLLQVRTYDVMITYDKYYQTPRVWLIGHLCRPRAQDGDDRTLHPLGLPPSRVRAPCKHASVMKKVIERMNTTVVAEQLAQRKSPVTSPKDKDATKKKWFGTRKSSGSSKDVQVAAMEGEDEPEGMRVDFYLVVFLKFIASIVPTIEVDSTTSF